MSWGKNSIARWALMLTACQGFIACSDENSHPDAGFTTDAAVAGSLTLEFHRKPKFGGEWGGNPLQQINEVEMLLSGIFLIGDAAEAAPVPSVELLWPMDAPDKLRFTVADTPHGLYSRLNLRVMSYTIQGTCVVDQVADSFEMSDSPTLDVSVKLKDFRVEPDTDNVLHIDIDFKKTVSFDWSSVPLVEGIRSVTDSSLLNAAAQKLGKGFKRP